MRQVTQWSITISLNSGVLQLGNDALREEPTISSEASLQRSPAIRRKQSGELRLSLNLQEDDLMSLLEALHTRAFPLLVTLSSDQGEGWSGVLARLDHLDSRAVQLIARLAIPRGGQRFCRRLIDVVAETGLPWDLSLPRLYGRASFEAIPLFPKREARLLEAHAPDASAIVLRQQVDWPSQGSVQLADEVLHYSAISEDRTTLLNLSRDSPQAHRQGARVLRLPTDELTWCVADQNCSVEQVRANDEGGDLLTGLAIDTTNLSGQLATVLHADRFPLRVNRSQTSRLYNTSQEVESWDEGPNNAINTWGQIIYDKAPFFGSLFSSIHSVAELVYQGDLLQSDQRFDAATGLTLRFQLANTSGWGRDTRLLVTVSKGDASLSALYRRDGIEQEIEGFQQASIRKPSALRKRRKTRRLTLEVVQASSNVLDPEGVLTPRALGKASVNDSVFTTLYAGFYTPQPIDGGNLISVTLLAEVENDGDEPCPVTLVGEVPGSYRYAAPETINPGERRLLSLTINIPTSVAPEEFVSTEAIYGIELPEGGNLSLSTFIIDAVVETDPVELEEIAGLDRVRLEGPAPRVTYFYSDIEMDLSSLLDQWPQMTLFSHDPPLILRFEILNPPSFDWRTYLRDTRIEIEAFPMTSLQPIDRLWVTAQDASHHATRNAASVLEEILIDNTLVDLAEDRLDQPAMGAAKTVCSASDRFVARLIDGDESIADVVESLLGEANLTLNNIDGLWRVDALPYLPNSTPGVEIMGGSIIADREETAYDDLVSIVSNGVVYTKGDKVQRVGTTPYDRADLQWLERGGRGHASRLLAESYPYQSTTRLRLAATASHRPGETVEWRRQGKRFVAEVAEKAYAGGLTTLGLRHRQQLHRVILAEGYQIRWLIEAQRLAIVVEGRPVAHADCDGNFFIAGSLFETSFEPPRDDLAVAAYPADQHLLIGYGVPYSSAVYLDSQGNLHTSVPLRENRKLPAASNAPVDADSAATRLAIGDTAVGSLNQTFDLAGLLFTNQST